MKRTVLVLALIGTLAAVLAVARHVMQGESFLPAPGNFRTSGPWESGRFKMGMAGNRPIFLDPNGKPFYSIGMVYAYDPEAGPFAELTWERVKWDLEAIKAHGFNTLNLYGDKYLPDVLVWCDRNGIAVVLRTSYTDGLDLSSDRREYPDFMDRRLREFAAQRYDTILAQATGHPSLLAVDMDQRWLFPLDWSGSLHSGEPKLGPAALEYFPVWLEERFRDISALNSAWGRSYASFADALGDPDIIRDGKILPLGKHPWRLDVVEYTLWTIDDFIRELSSALKKKDPGLLLTCTTEHPEVAPFPLTPAKAGIDFIAPVHYNKKEWYDRDWIAAGKAIYESRWHFDMQGLPVYIAETGWRTTPLDQWPRVTNYAFARPGDEKHLAGMYLRQNALWNAMPWMVGWAHFKMYDKVSEGDFGYLRDNRTEKPVSTAGRATNAFLQVASDLPAANRATILYPRYALASEKAGMRQLATLAYCLEEDALSGLESLATEAESYLDDANAMMRSAYVTSSVRTLSEQWYAFRFASEVPEDPGIVVLAGDPLENLSRTDRDQLKSRRTVSFSRAGVQDERCRATEPWFLEIAGARPGLSASESFAIPLAGMLNHDAAGSRGNFDGAGGAFQDAALATVSSYSAMKFSAVENAAGLDNIQCLGQTLSLDGKSGISELHAVVAVHGGDVALPLELLYDDGTRETKWLGVAARDWSSAPDGDRFLRVRDMRGGARVMTHLSTTVHPLRKLKSVLLPNDPAIHIFALTLVARSEGTMIPVAVDMGGVRIEGVTAWAVFLPSDAVPADRVLARFSDGRPAIILSEDKMHAAFLFDLLTWNGSRTMISRDLKSVAEIVRRVLKSVES
ncbi:MAG: hypothetical protein AAB229_04950 [Candidatus Hydrogenedentota bacterium]